MHKSKETLFILIYRILDILIVAGSFFAAFMIRSKISLETLEPFHEKFNDLIWHFLILLFIMWNLLYFNKVYISYRGKPIKKVVFNVVKANFQGLLLVTFILFFLQEFLIHRTLILLFFIIATGMLICEKIILYKYMSYIRKLNKNIKYALIIGTGNKARNLIKLFHGNPGIGRRIVGFLDNDPAKTGKEIDGVPIIGQSKDLLSILFNFVVDEVFIAISLEHIKLIREMIKQCEQFGINAKILLHIYKPAKASFYIDELLDTTFITFTTLPLKVHQLFFKTFIDYFLSFFVLLFFVPIVPLLILLIKIDSKGPAFYKQERSGRNGRRFVMYKFRTMIEEAESQRFDLEQHNEMEGPVFKIKNDFRITRIGKILRKTSVDEIPQFFNVLKGEMSIVGPRPLPVYESEKITNTARKRLSMKPGITGLWQVSGRNEVDFDKWMGLDLRYIENWSLWLDIKIILKTLLILLSRKGAY